MPPEAKAIDDDASGVEDPVPAVTLHRTKPGRVVFTELDNEDGWIATDLAVDPIR